MARSVVEQEEAPAAEPPVRRRWRRPSLFATVFALSVLAFLAARLGPSLVGAQVFVGVQVFDLFPPWSHLPGAADPVETTIHITDQIDSTFPAMNEMRDRLLRGDLASWSSMVGGGFALLGTINYGLMSPGRIMFLLLPTWLAPAWSKLIEIGFAGAFTYLLVRRLGGSRPAGAVAAFVYPMTGFIIGWTSWTQTAVASVIPMLFWAVERFLQERRVRDVAPVAVATALLVLGGFPAVAGQALYLAAGYAVLRVVVRSGRRVGEILGSLALLGAGVLLGILISAVQLLPFAAQIIGDVDLSYREGGFFEQVPLVYMLTSIFPGSFAENGLPLPASPMDLNAYVGGVVAILVALGILQIRRTGRHASALIYLVLVVVFVVALLWFQGGWSAWIGELPVFSGNPIGRLRSQLGLPAAVLAGFGIEWVRGAAAQETGARQGPGERWLGAFLALGVTALAGIGGALLLSGRILGTSSGVPFDVAATLIPMALVSGMLVARAATGALQGATVLVAAVAVVAQAFPATAYYWPSGDREKLYATSAGIEYLQENLGHDRIATLGHAIRPNTTHYYDLRVLNGHLFVPSDLAEVFRAIYPSVFIGATYTVFSPDVATMADSPGLDRYAVRYLVAQADSVRPGQPGVPVAIPGRAGPIATLADTARLAPGGAYLATIPAGDLRGVHVPLEVTERGWLSVVVRDAAGAVVAQNSRIVPPTAGLQDVPMALVAEPDAAAGLWQATVTMETGSALGTFDATGGLRLSAVRDYTDGDPADDGLEVVHAADGMVIWERASYLPRIRWAEQALVLPDPDERLDSVATRPAEAGEVILGSDPGIALEGGSGAELTVVEDAGDVIRVRTSSDAPGFLVVADSIQLDFAASVDGESVEIHEADHAAGAVAVPAGEHVVEITYSSVEQRLGAWVSAAAVAGLLALLVVPPILSRRRVPAAGEQVNAGNGRGPGS